MFNRQKNTGDAGLDDKASAKLRDLADTVRTIAPETFGPDASHAQRRAIPRKQTADSAADAAGLEHAARLSTEIDALDDVDDVPDFDSDVRMDVARRLRRHLTDLSPSERLEMVEEFVAAISNMGDCYRPQVIALIEQELGHTPYMTRQAANRLRQDIQAIGRVSIADYIELLSDSDFLDIMRGRGEFVQTAAERERAEFEAAAKARLIELQAEKEKEKGGLFNRLLSSDDAPRNVVPMTPNFAERAAKPKAPENDILGGQNRISRQAQRRIAHFIMASLFDTLVEQGRMRTEVARALRQSVRQRIEKARFESRMPMPSHDSEMDVEIADNEMVENDVIEARDAKMTIDQYVLDALSRNDDALVVQALAHYAQIPANAVSKILDSGSARAITALAWSAGMTAPAAVVLQISNGIPESAIESPAAGGRFAMAAADMDWYIDFFSDMKPVVSRAKVEKDSEPAPAQRQKVRSTIRNPERGFGPRSRSGRNSGGLEGLVSDRRSKGREED
jgi:polyhydroxyalkanoate synthesis regulator phasin